MSAEEDVPSTSNVKCWGCGEEGHTKKECPLKVSPNPLPIRKEDKVKEEKEEVVGAKEDRMPHLHHLHTGRATVRTSNVRTYHVTNLDTPRLNVGWSILIWNLNLLCHEVTRAEILHLGATTWKLD